MAAPSFVTGTKYDVNNSWLDFGGTSSFSKTVAGIGDANRAMVIVVGTGTGRLVSSAYYAGVAFTPLVSAVYPGYTTNHILYLKNAQAGNNALSVALNGNASGFVTVLQFNNVGSISQISASTYGVGSTNSLTGYGFGNNSLVVSAVNHFTSVSDTTSQTLFQYNWRYGNYVRITGRELLSGGDAAFGYRFSASDKYAHTMFALSSDSPGGGSGRVIWW